MQKYIYEFIGGVYVSNYIWELGRKIVDELGRTVSQASESEEMALINKILEAKRIFLAGAGRSGLMARGFAMRLMHMGFTVYFAGEVVSPSIDKEDLLIICSGSGATGSLVSMANKCKKIGAQLALVTIAAQSPIGNLADTVITIPAPTTKIEGGTGFTSIQPMGSLFEQSLLLVLDATILKLMEIKQIDEQTMFARHANLE